MKVSIQEIMKSTDELLFASSDFKLLNLLLKDYWDSTGTRCFMGHLIFDHAEWNYSLSEACGKKISNKLKYLCPSRDVYLYFRSAGDPPLDGPFLSEIEVESGVVTEFLETKVERLEEELVKLRQELKDLKHNYKIVENVDDEPENMP